MRFYGKGGSKQVKIGGYFKKDIHSFGSNSLISIHLGTLHGYKRVDRNLDQLQIRPDLQSSLKSGCSANGNLRVSSFNKKMKLDGFTKKNILKSLKERNKTLSELSRELGISKSSIHRHLNSLKNWGLVERISNGNKFVYYKLTERGREILDSLISVISAILSSLITYFTLRGSKKAIYAIQEKRLAYADHIPNPFETNYHTYSTDIHVAAILSFIFVFLIVFFSIKLFREFCQK